MRWDVERTRTPTDQEGDTEPHIYREWEQEQEREEIDLGREVDERAIGVMGGGERREERWRFSGRGNNSKKK